jgi:CheY-like chemotaxis protein
MAGLRAAVAGEHDVALVDIGLPDIDGYEVAQRLRASPEGRRLSLIAITGYGKEEDRSRALAAGFDRHMTKPVGMEALEEAIESVGSPLRRSA